MRAFSFGITVTELLQHYSQGWLRPPWASGQFQFLRQFGAFSNWREQWERAPESGRPEDIARMPIGSVHPDRILERDLLIDPIGTYKHLHLETHPTTALYPQPDHQTHFGHHHSQTQMLTQITEINQLALQMVLDHYFRHTGPKPQHYLDLVTHINCQS